MAEGKGWWEGEDSPKAESGLESAELAVARRRTLEEKDSPKETVTRVGLPEAVMFVLAIIVIFFWDLVRWTQG